MTVTNAGLSAHVEAEQQAFGAAIAAEQAALFSRAAAMHAQRAARFGAGSAGEQSIFRTMSDHLGTEWTILADRRWPGTRRANIDLIVVGPGGVFVVDAKNWADPRIQGATLWRGQLDASDDVAKVIAQSDALADVLAEHGLSPNQIHPTIVLAGQVLGAQRLGAAYVVGESSLASFWSAHGQRFDSADVQRLVGVLDDELPPAAIPSMVAAPPVVATVPQPPVLDEPELWSVEQVLEASRRTAEAGTIERWMTWLDPQQVPLVGREWNGPVRIRGAAGTGKTVVALHRAERLARRAEGQILMTSFVNTLPTVHRALFTMLAPDLDSKVNFRSLHSWCLSYLRKRGVQVNIDQSAATNRFPRAMSRSGAVAQLNGMRVGRDYWWEEINSVIKGRGITTLEDYLGTTRIGRRVPLRQAQREAVWAAFLEYERSRLSDGVHDWADVLLLAHEQLRADPNVHFEAVVVDEVQDLPLIGLRIVAELTRDRPAGLLLVGDGQQSVYVGGVRLSEAGIQVTGRSRVLDRNYRNGSEILERAMQVVAADEFEDLGEVPESGVREVEVDRLGGEVAEHYFDTPAELATALVGALRSAEPIASSAVLCSTNSEVDRWCEILRRAGVPVVTLGEYDGRPVDAVKVGTYQRAKGLEFRFVALPNFDRAVAAPGTNESSESYRERSELSRRRLFVAMTRARDHLWLAGVRTTS